MEENFYHLKLRSNPAPLGFLGFGITTILLNIYNLEIFGLSSAVLALGLLYGGIAQIIAGTVEWRNKSTFFATVFTSFGLFWLSMVALIVLPRLGLIGEATKDTMIAYLMIWGFFTLCMFFVSLKLSRAIQFLFGSLSLMFFLLALGDVTGKLIVKQFAGVLGLVCGLLSLYIAVATMLNEVNAKVILPLESSNPEKRTKKRKIFFLIALMLAVSFAGALFVSMKTSRNRDRIQQLQVKKEDNYFAIQKLIVDFHSDRDRWPKSVSELASFSRRRTRHDRLYVDPALDLSECVDVRWDRQFVEVEVFSEDLGALAKIFVQKSNREPNAYVVRTLRLSSGYGKIVEDRYESRAEVLSSTGNVVTMFFVDTE